MITQPTFPYSYKKRYYNHAQEKRHGFFIHSLYMFFYSRLKRLTQKKPNVTHWIVPFKSDIKPSPTITWIGHSTFLIEFGTLKILTDPIFGNASFLFKRIVPAPLNLHDLSMIDYVLLSHNHRDHMDEQSLKKLKNATTTFMVPLGDKQWFDRRNFSNIREHTWWQSTVFYHEGNPLVLTFLPAHHWSQRSLFDRNRSLWGSWMIQYNDYTVYFAGDTAYAQHFKTIEERFSSIDVALLPIGPCQPHPWMKHAHLNAQQAGQAFLDLKARHFIPMHWGTFYFGTDSFTTPIEYLTDWWKNERSVHSEQLHILKFGEYWNIEKTIKNSQSVQQTREQNF